VTPDLDLTFDLAILGAGISGLSFAHHAARAGLRTVVFDEAPAPGGCLHTVRTADGFWFELGAHTVYNSYGALIEIIEALGCRDQLQKRTKAPFRLWVDGKIRSVPSQLALGELFASAWRAFTEDKTGRTVEEYYGKLVGKGNWKRVFSPLISAVPSQPADAFPAEMIFKRRPRRKDFPRSFSFAGGLTTLVERMAGQDNVTLRMGAAVNGVDRDGSAFIIATSDGKRTAARYLASALPPAVAARVLAKVAPAAARALGSVAFAHVSSTGVVVEKSAVTLPRMAGMVPLQDGFLSVVTRDVIDDERFRGFAFHFRPGASLDERLVQISTVLGAPRSKFVHVSENQTSLPSPAKGHEQIVAALDAAIAGSHLYVTGNFFTGLAIEDCVLRSRAEAARLLSARQRE
jgi:protoporphyrinogen/coproporphyrinogen III oxidase